MERSLQEAVGTILAQLQQHQDRLKQLPHVGEFHEFCKCCKMIAPNFPLTVSQAQEPEPWSQISFTSPSTLDLKQSRLSVPDPIPKI